MKYKGAEWGSSADIYFYLKCCVYVCLDIIKFKKTSHFKKEKNPIGPTQELKELVNTVRLENAFPVLK